ncbi:Hypothetical protein CKL_2836 [Clostridium kluyveri DSM 555]|uniref:Uncharacterized protein n=1 Tax=Clostridium kluyveri (strain ATCC 8527 / DSM 555 / NBRC 12016 / NCIMB 10680 / K1) TaxID=431943 RepID=A5N152_CLOK5|nr:hypothetical protein [Clostridium kluyveri]EDK34848.1 Hypothetical protein CKL_2836 [Clostridium kluyveri DSM 555]
MSKKYMRIWAIVLFILLCFIGYGGYRYYHNGIYNKLLDKADSYMKNGEYKKAVDTYEEALKYENNDNIKNNIKQAREKLDETLKAQLKDKKEDNVDKKNTENKNSSYSNSEIDTITKEKAVELTAEYYKSKNENTKFAFDHEDIRNNETYYVIQVFDSMEDHSATAGWYYVNKKSGKVYEWDLGDNKLIPIN